MTSSCFNRIFPQASPACLLNNCALYPRSVSFHRTALLKPHSPHATLPQRSCLSILTPSHQHPETTKRLGTMASHKLYGPDTPDSVKNSKKLHLITQSTPNGQKLQIMLEELALKYGKLFVSLEWHRSLEHFVRYSFCKFDSFSFGHSLRAISPFAACHILHHSYPNNLQDSLGTRPS